MALLGVLVAAVLIAVVLVDAFEAMVLPRRVSHSYRLARFFYAAGWRLWRAVARRLPPRRRNPFLAVFGPLSVFGLLVVWASGLIFGFALLHWSLGTQLKVPDTDQIDFGTYLYFSGTTFFTLGYGDMVPVGGWGRTLSVMESGLGFGFLAVVISYLPVLYQAFSRREISISLLDARAGSPPTAAELLRRLGAAGPLDGTAGVLLAEWERWAAELLEAHLSYPALGFYRSQHDNQSWVGTLTTILDTSALLIAAIDGPLRHQARLTFAMARHAAVDLAMVAQTPPLPPEPTRLGDDSLARLWAVLGTAGLALHDAASAAKALAELRLLYEPFVNALAVRFDFVLPPFVAAGTPVDNWQTSAWMPRAPGLGGLPSAADVDEHFD